MKKRAVTYLLIGVLMVLLIAPAVFAARSRLLDPLNNLVLGILPNEDLSSENVRDNPALWVIAVFTVVFSVIYAGTGLVPVFKEQHGARVAFGVAFGIIGLIVPGIIGLMSGLGFVGLIVYLIFGIAMVFLTAGRDFMTGFTESGVRGQRAGADYQNALSERRQAERDLKIAQREAEKEDRELRKQQQSEREEEGLVNRLKGIQSDMGSHLNNEKKYLEELRNRVIAARAVLNRGPETDRTREIKQEIINNFAKLVPEMRLVQTKLKPLQDEIAKKIKDANKGSLASSINTKNRSAIEGEMITKAQALNKKWPAGTAPGNVRADLSGKIAKFVDSSTGKVVKTDVLTHLVNMHLRRVKILEALADDSNAFTALNGELTSRMNDIKAMMTGGDLSSTKLETEISLAIQIVSKMDALVDRNRQLINAWEKDAKVVFSDIEKVIRNMK